MICLVNPAKFIIDLTNTFYLKWIKIIIAIIPHAKDD